MKYESYKYKKEEKKEKVMVKLRCGYTDDRHQDLLQQRDERQKQKKQKNKPKQNKITLQARLKPVNKRKQSILSTVNISTLNPFIVPQCLKMKGGLKPPLAGKAPLYS